ncbi:PREDICTED: crossover junction endonuclease MUS81-like [Acropora digitifera]|uniref:crossover junction endonuclease MUS81-like n=1 Tax=Acropora digitifera TaxID=70779 RepID=UPI00077A50FA|nr:PREDICTED: crossover junction endonuclease MUS81-like [Acropora digitifera]
MSLTADELKLRAQPLTNTDLENKQGRWFGGFDSLENTLVKNELVLKEARTPKYSLTDKGQPLAARCSEFDYAVQNLTQTASIPTIPVIRLRPVVENRQVCLLVDSEEPLMERFVRVASQKGLSAKTRRLPVGDFLWILLPPGANPDTMKDMPDQELVLPMLVERKTWDDLWSSTKTRRFLSQVQRMKACGLKKLFYLVEGSPKDMKGNPGPEVETFLKDTLDTLLLTEQFLVNRTGSWMKTVEWLCHLTAMSVEFLQAGILGDQIVRL